MLKAIVVPSMDAVYFSSTMSAQEIAYHRLILFISHMLRWIDEYCPDSDDEEEIFSSFELLASAVAQFDSRFTLRALRSIAFIRKNLKAETLAAVIIRTYPLGDQKATIFLRAIGTDEHSAVELPYLADPILEADPATALRRQSFPEIDVFIGILIQVFYILHSIYLIAY